MAKLAATEISDESLPITIREFRDFLKQQYKKVANIENSGNMAVLQLATVHDLIAYVQHLKDEGKSRGFISMKEQIVRGFYKEMANQSMIIIENMVEELTDVTVQETRKALERLRIRP